MPAVNGKPTKTTTMMDACLLLPQTLPPSLLDNSLTITATSNVPDRTFQVDLYLCPVC
jgi:hypothetical protein